MCACALRSAGGDECAVAGGREAGLVDEQRRRQQVGGRGRLDSDGDGAQADAGPHAEPPEPEHHVDPVGRQHRQPGAPHPVVAPARELHAAPGQGAR